MTRWISATVRSAALFPMLALAAPANAVDANAGKPLRGHDDRVVLDSTKPPYPAIGRLNLGSGRQFCTGTLIAADKVLTAAHCLVDARTKQPFRPDEVHFVAGQRRDVFVDHARAKCLVPINRSDKGNGPDYSKYKDDVAIVILAKPLTAAPAKLAVSTSARPGSLFHPAYSKSRPYLLSQHSNCKVLHKSRGVWLTGCDTEYGSSGGPLFEQKDDGPRLVAVMSGITRTRGEVFSLAVPAAIWADLAGSASCSAD